MSASTAVHSNAFNFQSHVQHGVDPRTGLYTVSMAIPEMKCNALAGPVLPLTLAFSPMTLKDLGYGQGWRVNLTEYDPFTGALSLGTGESYRVTGSGPTPDIAEKKLDNFHFHNDGNDTYRVVHKAGHVEVLKVMGSADMRLAMPVEIIDRDGRRLVLSYTPFEGGSRLSSVADSNGELLRVVRNDNVQVSLQFYPGERPDGGPLASFVLHLDANRWVTKVVLPTEERASWRIKYEVIRGIPSVTELWTPVGAHETIEYRDEGHPFPGGAHLPLPRVTRHLVDPGAGQPVMEVKHSYGHGNFLGHGGLDKWSDDGQDNLYKVADASYTYDTTAELINEGKVQRTVKRVFSRFHLLTEEVTVQGNCRKEVVTTHYADLPENRNKSFAEQPAQCQLIHHVTTRWNLTNDPTKSFEDVETTLHDVHGNLLERINVDGTREVNTYYPANGDGQDCPRDPEGFVRTIASTTIHPAPSGEGGAPTLGTRFFYTEIQPLAGGNSTPFLRERRQAHYHHLPNGQSELLRVIDTDYFDDPGDPLRLGRACVVRETLNAATSTTRYQYRTEHNRRLGARVLEITETLEAFDGTSQQVTQSHSVLNGQPLRIVDPNGVEMQYAYDALGRLVRETVAPGMPEEASRHYRYYLLAEGAPHGERARQEMSDVKGVCTRTWLDGVARVVQEERQDVDSVHALRYHPAEVPFRSVYSALFDGMGQQLEETQIDWLEDVDLKLVTRFEYDNWGERERVTGPDGVTAVTEISPFGTSGPTERRWLESADTPAKISERQVVYYNRFRKPESTQQLDADGRTVFMTLQRYNGLGQCVASTDMTTTQEHTTRYAYDVWERRVSTTLPDESRIAHTFAAHSVEALPVGIEVTPANESLPTVMLGVQQFDGLDRLVSRTVGGRTEQLFYQAGAQRPERRTTPAGNDLRYSYQPSLTEEPRTLVAPDDDVEYRYDLRDGAIIGARNQTGERAYGYSSAGVLRSEQWTAADGATYLSEQLKSRLGRVLQRDDSGPGANARPVHSVCSYDSKGRLISHNQGIFFTTLDYDSFSRVRLVATRNGVSGETVSSSREYDQFGRETLRTITTPADTVQITQEWYPDGELQLRRQKRGQTVVLEETFTYDPRNRLQQHVCTGTELPTDAHGAAFSSQIFAYDALDNLTLCRTRYPDDTTDIASHTFSDDDPCQLVKITHTRSGYPEQTFSYDADGNLRQDTQGNTLDYDSLGRLTSVTAGRQTVGRFHYDGHSELTRLTQADGTDTVRFYEGMRLHHEVTGSDTVHFLRAGAEPVAQQGSHAAQIPQLLLSNAIGSVIGSYRENTLTHRAYTAYGDAQHDEAEPLGYNGERREAQGWYLLGRGYRAYSPALMRFHSPDSESPFGAGGLNPYAYCAGNPIGYHDPTGHYRQVPDYIYPQPEPEQPKGGSGLMGWLGVAIGGVVLAVTLYLAPWSLGVTAPLMVKTLIGAGVQAVGMAVQAVGALNGSLPLQAIGGAIGVLGSMASFHYIAKAAPLLKTMKASAVSVGRGRSVSDVSVSSMSSFDFRSTMPSSTVRIPRARTSQAVRSPTTSYASGTQAMRSGPIPPPPPPRLRTPTSTVSFSPTAGNTPPTTPRVTPSPSKDDRFLFELKQEIARRKHRKMLSAAQI